MKQFLQTEITGHVLVKDQATGEILLDAQNAIHTINMPRILARGLAKEPNYYVYQLAFGNGGSFIDASGAITLRAPNDGTGSDGWQSQLYNQTFEKIVDSTDPSFDSTGGTGVVSQEVGSESNVIVTCYLGPNEPSGELSNSQQSNLTGEQLDFQFDEIGLYSFGLPLASTSGIAAVNVGNLTSTSELPISPGLTLQMQATVDGITHTTQLTLPTGGTGPNNTITFGDFCEGFNSGSWITSGDQMNNFLYTFITDESGGLYPSIINKQSFGFLVFQSKTTGSTSSVVLTCNSGNASDFFNVLTNGQCGNVNVASPNGTSTGVNPGVQNDPTELHNTCPPPASAEARRLLTHIIFQPILKSADRTVLIQYTLTVSVKPSQDSQVSIQTN